MNAKQHGKNTCKKLLFKNDVSGGTAKTTAGDACCSGRHHLKNGLVKRGRRQQAWGWCCRLIEMRTLFLGD